MGGGIRPRILAEMLHLASSSHPSMNARLAALASYRCSRARHTQAGQPCVEDHRLARSKEDRRLRFFEIRRPYFYARFTKKMGWGECPTGLRYDKNCDPSGDWSAWGALPQGDKDTENLHFAKWPYGLLAIKSKPHPTTRTTNVH